MAKMEVGQQWITKGSKRLFTIIDIHEGDVEILFEDTGSIITYLNKSLEDMAEIYVAKGQVWKFGHHGLNIVKLEDDLVYYEAFGSTVSIEKKYFTKVGERLL